VTHSRDAAEVQGGPIATIQGLCSKPDDHHSTQFALNQQNIPCQPSDKTLYVYQPLILPHLAQKVTPMPPLEYG
jgi:hypothetical protein